MTNYSEKVKNGKNIVYAVETKIWVFGEVATDGRKTLW